MSNLICSTFFELSVQKSSLKRRLKILADQDFFRFLANQLITGLKRYLYLLITGQFFSL
jgi:hypothetical protein